jgi:hypothetical protein
MAAADSATRSEAADQVAPLSDATCLSAATRSLRVCTEVNGEITVVIWSIAFIALAHCAEDSAGGFDPDPDPDPQATAVKAVVPYRTETMILFSIGPRIARKGQSVPGILRISRWTVNADQALLGTAVRPDYRDLPGHDDEEVAILVAFFEKHGVALHLTPIAPCGECSHLLLGQAREGAQGVGRLGETARHDASVLGETARAHRQTR